MALSFALIITLVAVANAGLVWVDDHENEWNPFQPLKMIFPQFPKLPGFPRHQGPRNAFGAFGFNIPFPNMPKMPTPADILNAKPKEGQILNGVIAKSSSSYTTDKDGKPVRTGGNVVVINDNGDVKKYESGNKPPNVNEPIFPPFGI